VTMRRDDKTATVFDTIKHGLRWLTPTGSAFWAWLSIRQCRGMESKCRISLVVRSRTTRWLNRCPTRSCNLVICVFAQALIVTG
jgi:hypothetical protein